MVVGNGMIATEFKSYSDKDDYIIFASGVSDSTSSLPVDFERERTLLSETIAGAKGRILVYFSTCSIYDSSMQKAAYVIHKKNMEKLIISTQPSHLIFRLSNPVGKTSNTHTVVNYFIKNIQEQHPFEVWKNASRNIIDLDHLYMICNEILENKLHLNTIINIANPANYPVPFIVSSIEKHFHLKGNYVLADKGDGPQITAGVILPYFRKFNINFDESYLPALLKKYFPVK